MVSTPRLPKEIKPPCKRRNPRSLDALCFKPNWSVLHQANWGVFSLSSPGTLAKAFLEPIWTTKETYLESENAATPLGRESIPAPRMFLARLKTDADMLDLSASSPAAFCVVVRYVVKVARLRLRHWEFH